MNDTDSKIVVADMRRNDVFANIFSTSPDRNTLHI